MQPTSQMLSLTRTREVGCNIDILTIADDSEPSVFFDWVAASLAVSLSKPRDGIYSLHRDFSYQGADLVAIWDEQHGGNIFLPAESTLTRKKLLAALFGNFDEDRHKLHD